MNRWHFIGPETSVQTAVNAGIDMLMEPSSSGQIITYLKALVNVGSVPQTRIDDAVKEY